MAAKIPLLPLVEHEIDLAVDDAKAFGGGWLLVDPQGGIRRVIPPEVLAWAARQMESR